MKLKIHCFRHVEFEYLGHIAKWANQRGGQVGYTNYFAQELPPSDLDAELLVILGGPMGVHDESRYPWLVAEKKAIERAIKKGTKILGICLGAQLVASVMGANVKKDVQMEVGWCPLMKERANENHLLRSFPNEFSSFQWHGDTFDIPAGTTRTFSSAACANQGFIGDNQIVGFQFHPEIEAVGIKELLEREYGDTSPGPWVQSPSVINEGNVFIEANKEWLFRFLNLWTESLDVAEK